MVFIVLKKRKCYLNLFHFMSFTSLLTSKIGSPQKNIVISYVLYSKVVMVFFPDEINSSRFQLVGFVCLLMAPNSFVIGFPICLSFCFKQIIFLYLTSVGGRGHILWPSRCDALVWFPWTLCSKFVSLGKGLHLKLWLSLRLSCEWTLPCL